MLYKAPAKQVQLCSSLVFHLYEVEGNDYELVLNTVAYVAKTSEKVSTHPEFVEAEDIENKNAIKHAWVRPIRSSLPTIRGKRK